MPAFIHRRFVILLFLVLCLAVPTWFRFARTTPANRRTIALLVPDSYKPGSAAIWKQAASEEGVRLDVVTASTFLRGSTSDWARYAGIIVPDTIHKRANTSLIESLRNYVDAGGNLMTVFDALTLDLSGVYPQERSRLSALTGVPYALFEKFGTAAISRAGIVGNRENFDRIGFTPGRFETERPVQVGAETFDQWLTTYQYKELRYPYFLTGAVEPGTRVLLGTATGHVAASAHRFGKGRTLFVNLPLGVLKNSTDSLPLHAFLRYFSDEFARMPRLLASPGGIGGLVLNIHVDNGAAIRSLDFLRDMGMFEQGPYSIHFTAGPDVNRPGDGLGMDVANSPVAQQWIRRFVARGDEVGNHGGWIHNYFGTGIREDNQAEFERYLVLNNDAMRRAAGRPITEYSAPIGNQPLWVTRWLAENGIKTYYTTSNVGMGPTRMFINDRLIDKATWSLPITPFGRIASFEEAMFSAQSAAPITAWLQALVSFVADKRVIREIYCHPIGVPYYADSVRALLESARTQAEAKRFGWHAMTEIADFMSRRELVSWRVDASQGQLQLEASHPNGLQDMTWQLPADQCARPVVKSGTARISRDGPYWQVAAQGGKQLQLACTAAAVPVKGL